MREYQKTTRSLNEEKTSRFNSRVATDADKEIFTIRDAGISSYKTRVRNL